MHDNKSMNANINTNKEDNMKKLAILWIDNIAGRMMEISKLIFHLIIAFMILNAMCKLIMYLLGI